MTKAVRDRAGGSEDGFAVVIALLVTAIAFLVLTSVIAEAIHNVVASGYVRRRTAAINAAEAGLNWYANQLSTTNIPSATNSSLGWTIPPAACWDAGTSIPNSCWYVLSPSNPVARSRVTVADRPETATFELRVLFMSENPCPKPAPLQGGKCSLSSFSVKPTVWNTAGAVTQKGVLKAVDTPLMPWPDTAYAVIRSVGSVGTVSRSLETYVRLRAVRISVPGGFLSEAACLGNAAKLVVNGDFSVANQASALSAPALSVFDSDCQTGNLAIASGDEMKLYAYGAGSGSVFVRGGGFEVAGTRTFEAAKDVWAEGPITLGSGSSALTCPTSGSSQCVQGDVIGSAVTVGSRAWVGGSKVTCAPACPPQLAFPEFKWAPSQWQSPWTVQTVSNTVGLLNLIEAQTSPTVFRVLGSGPGCDLEFKQSNASGNDINLKTQVAVFSACRFTFANASAEIKMGAPGAALLLISEWPSAGSPNCGSPTRSSPGPQDISINQNPTISTGFFAYTPCFLWIGNNQNPLSSGDFLSGQFAGRYLVIDQAVTLTQVNLGNFVATLPGILSGFNQDVRFVREISLRIALANGAL